MTGVIIRRGGDTEGCTEERPHEDEADMGHIQSQAKEHPGPPGAEKEKEGFFPSDSRMPWSTDALILDF